jgi:hypothetical protein
MSSGMVDCRARREASSRRRSTSLTTSSVRAFAAFAALSCREDSSGSDPKCLPAGEGSSEPPSWSSGRGNEKDATRASGIALERRGAVDDECGSGSELLAGRMEAVR